MKIVRGILLVLIVVIAGIVSLAAMGMLTTSVPTTGAFESYLSLVDRASSEYDLLMIVASQNAVIIFLLKALVVMCALAVSAVAVVGVTLLDRRKDQPAAPAAPVPAAPSLPESP